MMSSIASRGSDSAAAIVSTPTGPPPNLTAIGVEVAAVHLVEADRVDVEQAQRAVGERARHHRRALDGGEIPYPAQQAPGDARRAARAPGNLIGSLLGEREADHPRAAGDNRLQLLGRYRS